MDGRKYQDRRKKLDRLAWYLDSSIKIPGLNYRVGLDALIGFIPGIGDTLGALLSSYILREAALMGAPKVVLVKMAFNIALDVLVGAIPVLGDLFDFVWKANQRNLRLFNAYLDEPRKTTVASRFFVGLLISLIVGFVILVGIAGVWLAQTIWNAGSAL